MIAWGLTPVRELTSQLGYAHPGGNSPSSAGGVRPRASGRPAAMRSGSMQSRQSAANASPRLIRDERGAMSGKPGRRRGWDKGDEWPQSSPDPRNFGSD